jgi:hypothetical protein
MCGCRKNDSGLNIRQDFEGLGASVQGGCGKADLGQQPCALDLAILLVREWQWLLLQFTPDLLLTECLKQVVKNPSDFIGSVLGESEKKTQVRSKIDHFLHRLGSTSFNSFYDILTYLQSPIFCASGHP